MVKRKRGTGFDWNGATLLGLGKGKRGKENGRCCIALRSESYVATYVGSFIGIFKVGMDLYQTK